MYATMQCCRPDERTYEHQEYPIGVAFIAKAGEQRAVLDFHTPAQVDDAIAELVKVRETLTARQVDAA